MLCVSVCEFFFLILFLIIGVVLFVSLIYYWEKGEKNIKFYDILNCFWWVVVIMMIVGYGDMVFVIFMGKFIGSICVVCGVLMIVFLVLVIVNNFFLYYFYV